MIRFSFFYTDFFIHIFDIFSGRCRKRQLPQPKAQAREPPAKVGGPPPKGRRNAISRRPAKARARQGVTRIRIQVDRRRGPNLNVGNTRTEPISGRDAWQGAGPDGGPNPSRTRTQDRHRGPEALKGSVEQF